MLTPCCDSDLSRVVSIHNSYIKYLIANKKKRGGKERFSSLVPSAFLYAANEMLETHVEVVNTPEIQ